MNIFKRLFISEKKQKRSFNAAKINRLSGDWITSPQQINEELKTDLNKLKVRCRDAAKNDAHMKKFLRMREVNIVGDNGIVLISSAIDSVTKQLDSKANEVIENLYRDFSNKKNFTVDGSMSRRDVEKLLVSSLVYDGEFFARIVRGYENDHNIAIQIMDSYQCDMLYNTGNKQLANGNYVVNGVEINDYGKPINYYFLTGRPDSYSLMTKRICIPAEDIIHVFKREYAGQTRGIPLAAAGIMKLNDLAGYTEAEIIAARTAACKMGFYTVPAGDEMIGPNDTKDIDGTSLLKEASPGTFEQLPQGWDFKTHNPDHPTGNHAAFVKTTLREIANAWNVSYNELANDLEGVNYSSIRQGVLFERDCWKDEQQFVIDHFETIIFNEWLKINLLNGKLAPLPYAKLGKFLNCDKWQGKRWTWVDPAKDAQTNEIMVANGWKTNDQITSEQGGDYYDNINQISQENKLKDKLGLTLGPQQAIIKDPNQEEEVLTKPSK